MLLKPPRSCVNVSEKKKKEVEKKQRVRVGTRKMNDSISPHNLDYKLYELLARE